jgi:hypothetical protein
MGQLYAKTYFPTGYTEFIKYITDENNSLEDVEKFILDYKDRVKEIINIQTEQEKLFRQDPDNFYENYKEKYCEKNQELDVNKTRLVYDTLVGFKICDFWLKIIEQPTSEIKQYYDNNKPKVEEIFYQVYKEYNINEGPQLLISYYKNYCC